MDEVVKEPVVTDEQKVEESTPQPGEKTDSALLLKSLQDEREKRRIAEEALKTLQETPTNDVFSDEGKLLKKEIDDLKAATARREEEERLAQLRSQYPALKDKQTEFDEYRLQNPGMRIETAAKAFLVDNDLFEAPARKGLERQSGGGRTAPKEGLSIEDVANLRVTNYRKYSQLVREGKIKVD